VFGIALLTKGELFIWGHNIEAKTGALKPADSTKKRRKKEKLAGEKIANNSAQKTQKAVRIVWSVSEKILREGGRSQRQSFSKIS